MLPATLVSAAYSRALSAFLISAKPGLKIPPIWKVLPRSIREDDFKTPKEEIGPAEIKVRLLWVINEPAE